MAGNSVRLRGRVITVTERPRAPAPDQRPRAHHPRIVERTMAYRSLILLVAALLLVLAIVVLITALGDYLFQPTPVY